MLRLFPEKKDKFIDMKQRIDVQSQISSPQKPRTERKSIKSQTDSGLNSMQNFIIKNCERISHMPQKEFEEANIQNMYQEDVEQKGKKIKYKTGFTPHLEIDTIELSQRRVKSKKEDNFNQFVSFMNYKQGCRKKSIESSTFEVRKPNNNDLMSEVNSQTSSNSLKRVRLQQQKSIMKVQQRKVASQQNARRGTQKRIQSAQRYSSNSKGKSDMMLIQPFTLKMVKADESQDKLLNFAKIKQKLEKLRETINSAPQSVIAKSFNDYEDEYRVCTSMSKFRKQKSKSNLSSTRPNTCNNGRQVSSYRQKSPSGYESFLSDEEYKKELKRMEDQYGYKEPDLNNIVNSINDYYNRKKSNYTKRHRECQARLRKRRDTIEEKFQFFAGKNMDIPTNIISDKRKELIYNRFINMCLINTSDDFVRAKYQIYLRQKYQQPDSNFYTRMESDIKERLERQKKSENIHIKLSTFSKSPRKRNQIKKGGHSPSTEDCLGFSFYSETPNQKKHYSSQISLRMKPESIIMEDDEIE